MDGIDQVEAADPEGRRGRDRDSLFLLARLRIDGEDRVREVRVRNLSEGGLMAEMDSLAPQGTAVRVELRGIGEVTGTIAWATAGRVGIALDRAIDPKRARKPVGRAAGPARAEFQARTPSGR